tara:strand:- start:190 stop:450 length:261 start_codon:yes stop_codon:yes gene_type:complete
VNEPPRAKRSEAKRSEMLKLTFTQHSFNAEKFKVFAVALSLTCEKLTGDKVFVEAFHPEYVAKKKGFSNNLRRAPHPALLLCYRGE